MHEAPRRVIGVTVSYPQIGFVCGQRILDGGQLASVRRLVGLWRVRQLPRLGLGIPECECAAGAGVFEIVGGAERFRPVAAGAVSAPDDPGAGAFGCGDIRERRRARSARTPASSPAVILTLRFGFRASMIARFGPCGLQCPG